MRVFAFRPPGFGRVSVPPSFLSRDVQGALLLLGLASWAAPVTAQTSGEPAGVPLRYLAMNVGNASPQFGCWKYKLCREEDVRHVQDYIAAWQPDVVLLSEVYRAEQLTGTEVFGPILPAGYDGKCGESRDRYTGKLASWFADDASQEHECVAWKTSRLSYVAGSARSAYGRNDDYGKRYCHYDLTGFRVRLLLDGTTTITAATVHPSPTNAACRTDEIGRYWRELAGDDRAVVIGGDWNTNRDDELQVPERFQVNYSRGRHWRLAAHSEEYTAIYLEGLIRRRVDHAYSSFGQPCTRCGAVYGTADLTCGSVLGSYDGHPRADAGEGLDHRQILVDMVLQDAGPIFGDTAGGHADDIAR